VKAALVIFAALAVVAAVGCGDSSGPAQPAPANAAKPKTAAAAAPDGGVNIVSTVPYMYNPVAKRDPFRNLLEEPRSGANDKNADAMCNEPLCGFDLDQLTLVAVVSGDANPVACSKTRRSRPRGAPQLARRQARRQVTQIQRDCVIVTEYFQTPDGKVNPNRVNLCIKQDKRSVPVLDLLQNKIFDAQ